MMATESSETPAPAEKPCRRTFSQRLLLGIAGLTGALAALVLAIPFIGYLMGPRRKNPIRWVSLGKVAKFMPRDPTRPETLLITFANPLGQRWDGATAQTGVYVRWLSKDREGKDQFMVLAMNCAHLGCPVQ